MALITFQLLIFLEQVWTCDRYLVILSTDANSLMVESGLVHPWSLCDLDMLHETYVFCLLFVLHKLHAEIELRIFGLVKKYIWNVLNGRLIENTMEILSRTRKHTGPNETRVS